MLAHTYKSQIIPSTFAVSKEHINEICITSAMETKSSPGPVPTQSRDFRGSEKTIEPSSPSNERSKKSRTAAGAGTEEYEYITGLKLVIVLASVTLAAFPMLLDTTIIVTAIPRITSDFYSLDDVGWYGSAYLLAK